MIVKKVNRVEMKQKVEKARKLINSNKEFEFDQNVDYLTNQNQVHLLKLLKAPLSDLDISVRLYNFLMGENISSIDQLISYSAAELIGKKRFSRRFLTEIEELLDEKGLYLGM